MLSISKKERETMERIQSIALNLVSSELTSYSSNMIGFSVILFASLSVFVETCERVPLRFEYFCVSWAGLRLLGVLVILFIINSIIIFTLMRMIYFGRIGTWIVFEEEPVGSLSQMFNSAGKKVNEMNLLGIIRLRWFSTGISYGSKGLWFSSSIGFLVSLFLVLLIFFY